MTEPYCVWLLITFTYIRRVWWQSAEMKTDKYVEGIWTICMFYLILKGTSWVGIKTEGCTLHCLRTWHSTNILKCDERAGFNNREHLVKLNNYRLTLELVTLLHTSNFHYIISEKNIFQVHFLNGRITITTQASPWIFV